MSGSNTGTLMQPDGETAYNDSVSKVAETLAKFEQEHSIPEPPSKPADDSKSTPEPELKDDSELEQESDDSQESADDETPTPEAKEGDSDDSSDDSKEKPAIPENYYRAAVHQGWTPERISKLYDVDPEGTVDWLKELHTKENNLNGQFAEMGRAKIELERKQAEAVQSKETKPELSLENFKEQYEDDPADAIFNLIQSKQAPVEQPAVQPAQTNQREEDMEIAQQLHTFFTGKDLKAYQDFYGSPDEKNPYDWRGCLPGQNANRQAVIEEADAIMAGYEMQGKQISVADALEKAHLRVSAPIAEKIVREKLVSKIKKRSKGITLKPSGSESNIPNTKLEEKSEAKAEQTAKAGLTALFGNKN